VNPLTYAQRIVDTVNDPLLVLNGDLKVLAANRSFYKAFRSSPEETLGKPFRKLGTGQWNLPALFDLLGNVLSADGDLNDYPVEHDFPSLGLRSMLLNARRLQDGEPQQESVILLSIKDVTERSRAERALKFSEIRYRRLFEAAHDGILILDAETRQISDVNPFLLEMLLFPREYFIGKELWEIGVFRDKDASQEAMAKLKAEGTIRFEDRPLQGRDGHRHPVEVVANIYPEDHNNVIQCNIRDISDRKRFEVQREALLANEQAARMEAEAANHSKDMFLATLSHEVRTPLNAVLGWASVLRTGKYTEAELAEGIEVIDRNCHLQAQLIEDVLDVSRVVSGKLRLESRPSHLTRIIADATDVVRGAAEAKGIVLSTDLDPRASEVFCDPKRMQQVVWNLLTNAIKFSSPGSTVRIALARDRSTARIEVSDTGVGISPEFLPQVFERFRQADSGTRRKQGGLGLGLSIVKSLVELHGGTVEMTSEGLGRGTTVTVHLPIRAVSDADPGVESPDDAHEWIPPRLDGLRVLVVDDEPDARRLLSKVLTEAGALLKVAASAAEAMEAMTAMTAVTAADPALRAGHTAPFDIMISDISMPDEDGYDLIRRVRAAGFTAKQLPAVALTAFAQKEDRRRVLQAGFQVHVAKPVDPHELIALVASLAGLTG
jgi:PAS domain S-box-containing protein